MKKLIKTFFLPILAGVLLFSSTGCNKISTVKKISGNWMLESYSKTESTRNEFFFPTYSLSDVMLTEEITGGNSTLIQTETIATDSSSFTTISTTTALVEVNMDILNTGEYFRYITSNPQTLTVIADGSTTVTPIVGSSESFSQEGFWNWGNADKVNNRVVFNGFGSFVIQESSKDKLILVNEYQSESFKPDETYKYSIIETYTFTGL